jgi:hypothetical protein
MLLDPPVVSPKDFSNTWGAVDTEEALMLSGIYNARLKDCIVSALVSVWDVPTMCPAQLEVCYPLLHPKVHWMGGGGNKHKICPVGVIKQGIISIFMTLLLLLADVMQKFESFNPTWGNVGVFHLGAIYNCNQATYSNLLCRCSLMSQTSSMFFIFLSLHSSSSIIVMHLRSLSRAHMSVPYVSLQWTWLTSTSSMGPPFAITFALFGWNISGKYLAINKGSFVTATFPSLYVWLLLELLTVNLTIGNCILRGSTVDFCHRYISMKLEICSNKAQFLSKGLNLVAEFLNNNQRQFCGHLL